MECRCNVLVEVEGDVLDADAPVKFVHELDPVKTKGVEEG